MTPSLLANLPDREFVAHLRHLVSSGTSSPLIESAAARLETLLDAKDELIEWCDKHG